MEKSFDLGSMLKKHQKKHKSKPMQFESVEGGVHRRRENNIKHRKSTRLTSYDCGRNIAQPSPEPAKPETNQKNPERRRQQLEKWKEEKENKKKLLAAQKKKKPFIATAAQQYNPLKYVPPPPIKPVPSASGCVTRSQSAKSKKEEKKLQPQSFAPKNAGFRAPEIKTLTKMPKLVPPKSKKDVAASYTFNPVVPAAKPAAMQTRSRAYNKIVAESRQNRSTAKTTKPTIKQTSKAQKTKVQSSSSSENEQMQTSSSSSNVDLTVKMVSSSSEENSDVNYASGNDTSRSLKSLQSSSGDEPSFNRTPSQKTLQFTSSSESDKDPPVNIVRKSLTNTSLSSKSISTPSKSPKQPEKQTTPRNSIPKSESSSEEKLRSPKSPQDVPMTPEQVPDELRKISPCVTMSRGKDNARKEMKKKMEEGLFEEDESDMDGVEHFQRQLSSEIKRITEVCDTWDNIYEQVSLPDFVQELVLGAVGQARLLMSQKMQQFASLVQRCARPEPRAPLVTPADLQGFWDMVFMQVENVDMRFKKLDELRARNWVEEKPAVRARRPPRPAPAPAPAAAPPRSRTAPAPAPHSKLRDMIAAARKAKTQAAPPSPPVQAPEEKTFEAGFFSVRSPARSPAPRSPAPRTPAQRRDNSNLLKAVLSSEAEKASASKKSASFAMLRASVLGRNVECDGVEPLPQTPVPNLHATPGRSILKQSQESAKKPNKQLRIVLFNETRSNDLDSSSDDVQENNNNTNHLKTKESPEKNKDFKVDTNRIDKEEKENAVPRLVRQNAVEKTENLETTATPRMVTRKMRKSMISPNEKDIPKLDVKTPRSERTKRSTRKEALAEVERNVEDEKTPRRSMRRRKSDLPKVG